MDAGAYVVMRETRGWFQPLSSHTTFDGAMDVIKRNLECEAGKVISGMIPGQHRYYIVPVEALS